jgi:17beta-estradiol 17-dehydrogenase / very-long-chain 3-oxoacyl-CoA reductase
MQAIKEAFKFAMIYYVIQILPLCYKYILSRLYNYRVWSRMEGKWVIITGATDGIGKALALSLSKMGMKMVLIGRDEEKLNDVYDQVVRNKAECEKIILDFSKDMDLSLLNDDLDVGMLINNAGCCSEHPMYFHEEEKTRDILSVNILSAFLITKMIIKKMMSSKCGYIINIGSFTADIPCPLFSTYSSSKHMIRSWSNSLSAEVFPQGVHVEYINTGYVATKMSKIWNPSLFVPSPDTYARSVLSSIGTFAENTPYFPHILFQSFIILLPNKLLGAVIRFRCVP